MATKVKLSNLDTLKALIGDLSLPDLTDTINYTRFVLRMKFGVKRRAKKPVAVPDVQSKA